MSAEDFNRFYSNLFASRWENLVTALKGDVSYREIHFPGASRSYFLDAASYEIALALQVKPGMMVLDMCAAPGGKSLVLASLLQGQGRLVCNDRSQDRRARLRRVLQESLPEEWLRPVVITGHDATRWGLHEQQTYDRILLDAPCSSERHVLASPKHLKEWSPSRSKRLAIQQFAMVAAAVDAIKIGGEVLYSTCSLSPKENDEIIAKLLKKRKGKIELSAEKLFEHHSGAEKTEYGWHFLPDKAQGSGPLWCTRFQRIS